MRLGSPGEFGKGVRLRDAWPAMAVPPWGTYAMRREIPPPCAMASFASALPPSPPTAAPCLPPRCFHLAAAAYLAWGLIWAKSGGGHVHGKGTGRQNSGAPWIGRELFWRLFLEWPWREIFPTRWLLMTHNK